MKRMMIVAALIVFLHFPSVIDSQTGKSGLVWVAQYFSGGAQCEPGSKYDPPDVKQLLERAGIVVYETRKKSQLRCLACSMCPSYAAIHYARIQRNKVDAAQRLGFWPKDPDFP